jgi:glycerophosphoryl diester phosphodiesterase
MGGEFQMQRIGHRGAAGHEPENTIASIEKAIELQVDYVEFDVQSSADGRLVVIHDKRVDRTTDGKGLVRELSWDDLRKLDAGRGRELRIPLLEEVLSSTSGRVGLMLEMVSPRIAEAVHDTVKRSGFVGEIIYASFLHAEVLELRHRDERCATLALLEGAPVDPTGFARDAKVSHVGLAHESLTPELVAALKEEGFLVFVYTVNDRKDAQALSNLGVDGIVSDYPEIVAR